MNPYLHSEATTPASRRVHPARMAAGIAAFVMLLLVGPLYAQDAMVTISKSGTVKQILHEIESQTDYLFVVNAQVDVKRPVHIDAQKKTVREILDRLFAGRGVGYELKGKNIMLSPVKEKPAAEPDRKMISGRVTDASGTGVAGATVIVKGTPNGTTTVGDGSFSLDLKNAGADAVLQISFIGMKPVEVAVAGASQLNIRLEEDTQLVDAVVVTALGVKREEKALGYAVQKVSGDELGTVKNTFVGTALTGKVAGLQVRNSTEFGSAPTLRIRGESPLLVVDGVPYEYVALSELVADDIESIDVLKGASASALYGAKGGSGAVMVTTKKAKKEGLDVSVNSSLMADVGFLAFPDVQTQYSSGAGGKYLLNDAVWGDKLDIGRTATLYNPYTYENEPDQPLVSRGRNNFENFLQTSFVANNTVSIAYKGKLGSFRTSVNHIYNRGQYPNTKLNKTNYSLNGDLKYKRFSLSAGLTYNYATYPNNYGTGYGKGSYIYNLVIFQGTEYDIRDFRNYWVKPDEQQNWVVNGSWYDNPYFLANENTHGDKQHLVSGYLTLGYDLASWLKLTARTGVDAKNGRQEWREAWSSAAAPRSGESHKKGYYEIQKRTGFSINQDVMFTADKTWGGFGLNVMAGMNAFYRSWDTLSGYTQGGLTIPGYYSLKASVNPALASSTMSRRRSMSLYGKATLSWKSMAYVDVTARNDWSSTLPAESRSYFYPSVAGSFILTEVLPKMRGVDLLKVRGSWTRTKMDLGVYDIDRSYTISADRWGGMSGADYPDKIRGSVNPETKDAYEIGVAGIFFGNRLRADVTYYQTLSYDFVKDGTVSNASGFTHKKINTKEELLRRGAEVMLSATPVKTKDWRWDTGVNWSLDRYYYHKLDPEYSNASPWVYEGARWDWIAIQDWERDPDGNIVHGSNGLPVLSQYKSKRGVYTPDWIWGWTNTVKWKNFTLSFSFDGRVGGIGFSTTDQALWNGGSHPKSANQFRYDEVVNGRKTFVGRGVKVISGSVDYDAYGRILRDDRVFAPNDRVVSYEAYVKEYNPTAYRPRWQNYFDQSFIKLRDVSLTWNIPQPWCAKLGLKSASLSFIGQNLLMWTKGFKYSDPDSIDLSTGEENLSSPSLRLIGYNLKLNF
ncbi:SusC/RagA family TonB-linked outer membrane protein [Alistipes timonensis]|uniref:SusC/RagA family TonB-linked outer membrane protein n=1 Tax=Alistipes timonensis TaxID=1465754 RepID=UPI001E39D813|nr:SusC/RagA family TonB-linked outer membrane protein [Alistipes timonensis]